MSQLAPSDIPQGFSSVDPHGGGGGGDNAPSAEQAKKAAIQEQKQMIMDQACTKEALARLGRIKLVKPDKAAAVENLIVSMAMQGKLPGPINEGKLIEILERGSMSAARGASSQEHRISIQRKNYGMDSDDEVDNDDDL
jgi:programmed cell death protein 5